MGRILYIETGTNICSVAVGDNLDVISIKENNISNAHAAQLTVYINQVLSLAGLTAKQLDAVAVSKGPGSYTGLRIGVSAAKGICYAADIPLIAVESLDSMVYGVISQKQDFLYSNSITIICPMIDARRMEVYTALYYPNHNRYSDTEALIISQDSFNELLSKNNILFFGNGSEKCKSLLINQNAFFLENFFPSAQFMIPLANKAYHEHIFEDIAYFEPYYLKDFVATKARNKVINESE